MTPVDLPRAASVNRADPLYNADVILDLPIAVWLDGVEQQHVETYDIDKGFIIRAALDDAGKLRVEFDEILTECVTGVVTVALAPPHVG
jgi:hypothetical protein